MRKQKKNIVIFFGIKNTKKDPFETYAHKKSVYEYLFSEGARRGFNMYVASGHTNFILPLNFKNPHYYTHSSFIKKRNSVTADAILDRSGGLRFPISEINTKVINNISFKKLCSDKWKMYRLFPKYFPKSHFITSNVQCLLFLDSYDDSEVFVLKPLSKFGGKGIYIDTIQNLKKIVTQNELEYPYLIQRFVDTSCGVNGVVKGMHDIRVIIVNGKIVVAHVRKPKKGMYCSNVALGGSIREVDINKIPDSMMKIVYDVKKYIDKSYDKPLYSIDLGMTKQGPIIFELNDQIGFPSEEMKQAKPFIDELLNALILRTQRKHM